MKVFVGMSGGVDSSVAAALLVDQGYDVTGVFMKNWTQDLPGMKCPWADDLADAKRVAVRLGIPFKVYDFQAEYKQRVVDYMIREYQAGRTPNPDIMCNQEVKFKLFLEMALQDGADMIATGHYAIVQEGPTPPLDPEVNSGSSLHPLKLAQSARLFRAADSAKDQTYFLYRITGEALAKTLFPLGDMLKTEVRSVAAQKGLITADKKDSQGICFVGSVGIKEFLSQFVETSPGEVVEKESGQVLGYHDGAIFYTLGQRHGLGLGGGLPYYVVDKDMAKNIIYVSRNLNDASMWQRRLTLGDMHWITDAPQADEPLLVRLRHRGSLLPAHISLPSSDLQGGTLLQGASLYSSEVELLLDEPERAAAAGQSAVLYRRDEVLGGGIIV